MKDLAVLCVDVGSVKTGKFGWARASVRRPNSVDLGTDPNELCASVAQALDAGIPTALGFECPLFVPYRPDPASLTRARNGEGNRPWSAGAGSGSLAVGLVQTCWVLREVQGRVRRSVRATLDWSHLMDGVAQLFLWEAFVSAGAKASADQDLAHAADAAIAVESFLRTVDDPVRSNAIIEDSVHSLIGAALLRTGWSEDLSLLRQPCLVMKA